MCNVGSRPLVADDVINEAPAGSGRGPRGYRVFLLFADSDKTTSAAATMRATKICPSHFLGMSGTTLLLPAGPPKLRVEELREPMLTGSDHDDRPVAGRHHDGLIAWVIVG